MDGEKDPELYFNLFQSHAYWSLVAEEYDRRLEPFPFAGGVYVVNHAQNLSFRLQRKGVRIDNIVRAIAAPPGRGCRGRSSPESFGHMCPERPPRAARPRRIFS